ncbi:MAG TPA: polysaccharide deacetylase family protein [Streptosporangiaceae bacterium]|nr:polysaccharide deacetylase family protein [Streptosporangiaceae bacterium]
MGRSQRPADYAGPRKPPGRGRRVLLAAVTGLALTAGAAGAVLPAAPAAAAQAAAVQATAARAAAAQGPAAGRQVAGRSGHPGRTVVSLTFDDGDADQLTAARILHAHGMPGTFYIITGAVGTPGYLTVAQLRELARAGNEIGGHTVSHLDLTRLPAAEVRRQACQGRDTLLRWGFRVTSFAYPGGFSNPRVDAITRGCGFADARIATGLAQPGCPGCAPAETIPPARRYAIRTPGQVDGNWTLADLKQVVTGAQQSKRAGEAGGGWVPLVFHHVCAGQRCPPLSLRPSVLSKFTAWLAAQRAGGVTVRTVGQVAGGPDRPPVPLRPARPHQVVNPSMRTVAGSAAVDPALEDVGVPGTFLRCWMPGRYGNNTVTWRRTHVAHTGPWALRLQVTRYAGGDAKLLQQFDLGACSLPVTTGRSYQLAAWYRGNVRTQYSVYYRDRAGRWQYWTSSPFFQPATRWTRAAWATPPVPAGATGVSYGLAVAAKGTLITDDYSFRPAPPGIARPILDWSLLVLVVLAGGSWGARRVIRRRQARREPAAGPAPRPGVRA